MTHFSRQRGRLHGRFDRVEEVDDDAVVSARLSLLDEPDAVAEAEL